MITREKTGARARRRVRVHSGCCGKWAARVGRPLWEEARFGMTSGKSIRALLVRLLILLLTIIASLSLNLAISSHLTFNPSADSAWYPLTMTQIPPPTLTVIGTATVVPKAAAVPHQA